MAWTLSAVWRTEYLIPFHNIPISLELASDGEFQHTEAEKRPVTRQLRGSDVPANVPPDQAKLLMDLVCK